MIHFLQTSASLKFTVLNPKGRIWTMVAGGGASVIYADTVCLNFLQTLLQVTLHLLIPSPANFGFVTKWISEMN
jgi:succinyl-CoA synthetase beta subunit